MVHSSWSKAFLFKDVILEAFFQLKQLLLFFFTLSVFNCAPTKTKGCIVENYRRQGWDEIPV